MRIITPLAATVAAAALLSASAVAQTPPKDNKTMTPNQTQSAPTQSPTAPSTTASATQQQSHQWRGSQLIGLDVYNDKDEKVGDVTELITNANGQVEAVVVGVGGFLGLGRHDVALRWEDLRFVNEPRRTAATPPAGDKRATPPATSVQRANPEAPDHAVISLTTDELKALPAFKYAGEQGRT
jgi:sporulation protein YlmC with PRC-barrel domain